jgi:hypothetical protein
MYQVAQKVNASDSYSKGARFNLDWDTRLFLLMFCVVFLSPFIQTAWKIP